MVVARRLVLFTEKAGLSQLPRRSIFFLTTLSRVLAIKSASSTCAACRSVVSSDQNENLEIKKDRKENIDA